MGVSPKTTFNAEGKVLNLKRNLTIFGVFFRESNRSPSEVPETPTTKLVMCVISNVSSPLLPFLPISIVEITLLLFILLTKRYLKVFWIDLLNTSEYAS